MKKSLEISLNLLFWIISFYLLSEIFTPSYNKVDYLNESGELICKNTHIYIISNFLSILVKMLLFYINLFFLSKLFNLKLFKKYSLYLVALILVSFVLDVSRKVIIFGSEVSIYKSMVVDIWLYIYFVATSFVYILFRHWRREEILKQKLIEDNLRTELKLLKAQINPHFLFNTLNNLMSIAVKNNQAEVSDGIEQLSEMLRFLLNNNKDEKIHLIKEIEFIQNYISLNQLSYDDKDPIDVQFTVEGDVENIMISPTILIPFVENAFKHGIDIYSNSYIKIKLTVKNTTISFICTNSIRSRERLDRYPKSSGVGLPNVKRRLELLYPKGTHNLQISQNEKLFTIDLTLDVL